MRKGKAGSPGKSAGEGRDRSIRRKVDELRYGPVAYQGFRIVHIQEDTHNRYDQKSPDHGHHTDFESG